MEFIVGKKEEFFEFIDNISNEDKIALLTHTDLDGIASAIFMHLILAKKGLKESFVECLDLRENMMLNILPKLREKGITKILMTDVAADRVDSEGLKKIMGEIDLFEIDHHPIGDSLPEKNILKTESKYCAAWTVYSLAKKLEALRDDDWAWLASAAIVADYTFLEDSQFNFIRDEDPDFSKEKPFESKPGKLADKIAYSLVYLGKNANICDSYYHLLEKDMKKFEEYYAEVKKEYDFWVNKFETNAEFFPEKNIYFYLVDSKYGGSIIGNILSRKMNGNALIIYREDPLNENAYKLSGRSPSGKTDMNKLFSSCMEGFEHASGGGHPKASGGRILKKDFPEFKKKVLDYLSQ